MKQITWMIFGWLALVVTTSAASFDCAKASTKIEQMICADIELSELDVDLAEVYQQAQHQNGEKSKVITEQRQWIKNVRNTCSDIGCLRTVYQTRFEELANRKTQEETNQSESEKYAVRCDRHNQLLIISTPEFLPEVKGTNTNSDISEYTVYPGALTKIGGTEERPLILPSGRKLFRCQFGHVLYKVTIEPHIQNENVQGECGASEPDISLSVQRSNEQIVSNMIFDQCRGGSGKKINRVQFSESTSSIDVLSVPGFFLPISVERKFRLSSLALDWQKAVFEDYPTGDVNADLFVAVYKRDVAAISKALQAGANPNAKDLDGFPPVALLGTGRQDAYPNRMDEFNRQSVEMAKVLFAAGATGNAENIHGVTLLDYMLITNVPDSVIEMLMTHGADVRQGAPLVRAAFRGDEYLVRKFIDSGVSPNQKAKDGTTALWAAASTGFYSWSAWAPPAITEYAKCIRLLLQHGAQTQGAVTGSIGLTELLKSNFGKDDRLKVILAELNPSTR